MGHNHKLLVIMFSFCLSLVVAVATLFKRSVAGPTTVIPFYLFICFHLSQPCTTKVYRKKRYSSWNNTSCIGCTAGGHWHKPPEMHVNVNVRRCYMSRQPDSKQVNWVGWQRAATFVAQHPPSHATRSSCQTFPFTLTRVAETNALFMKSNKIKRAALVNVSVTP